MDAIRPTKKFNNLIIGYADIELLRSGECRISLAPQNHSLLRWIKAIGDESFWGPEFVEEVEKSTLQECAEDVFTVVRSLGHKHYHHKGDKPPSWVVTEWHPDDDRSWRKATMHALLRSAISLRRSDSADSFRRSLGVLAYADAFQKHLGTWFVQRGEAIKIKDRMNYDLGSLKASIEASLKVRELSDQTNRTRLLFAFGTLLTTLTLISPIIRGFLPVINSDSVPLKGQVPVIEPLLWMSENPILALFIAGAGGYYLDKLVTRIAFNRDAVNLSARFSQALDTFLAIASDKLKLGSRWTQVLIVFGLVLSFIAVAFMWLSVFLQSGFAIEDLV